MDAMVGRMFMAVMKARCFGSSLSPSNLFSTMNRCFKKVKRTSSAVVDTVASSPGLGPGAAVAAVVAVVPGADPGVVAVPEADPGIAVVLGGPDTTVVAAVAAANTSSSDGLVIGVPRASSSFLTFKRSSAAVFWFTSASETPFVSSTIFVLMP